MLYKCCMHSFFTVASPFNQSILTEACVTAGSYARVSEQRKNASNDFKCSELGLSCIPLAVETYGCWGAEARLHLSRLASRLAARLNCSKSHATSTLYGRLNLVLVRANARAMLSEHVASALTSQLNYYRLTLSCPIIVVVYLVCDEGKHISCT